MKHATLLAAAWAALASASPAAAQSDAQARRLHILPHIADGDGWRSSVLMTNAAQSASFCTLELYGLDVGRFEDTAGVTASGAAATFELAASGGSLVWHTRNERALGSGYATVDCNGAVTAQVVFAWHGDGERPTGIATVFSTQVGWDFQFPVTTAAGTLGFAIANDNEVESECGIVLEDPQRTQLGKASIAVPPKTSRAHMLHEAVAVPEGFAGGSAAVSCSRRVAMVGLHFELEPDGSIVTFNTLPPALLDTFPRDPDRQAKRVHVLPHIADGDGWRSSLLVTNVADIASRCTLELVGLTTDRFQAAEGIEAAGKAAAFELGRAGGYLVWGTRNEQALASGYATLDCTAPVVAQVVFARNGAAGRPTGMATVFSAQADRFFQLPVLTPAGTVGLAIANDTDVDAVCRIVLDDHAGVRVGEAPIAAPARTNVAQLLNGVVEIPEGFRGGPARAGCDQTVAAIGLHFELDADGAIATFNTLPPVLVGPVAPTVTLTTSRDSIAPGRAATLTWSATDAIRATITPDVGAVPVSGSRIVSPEETTTYRITVVGFDGRTAEASVTVTVTATLADRSALEALYESTGGEDWVNDENWLSDRPLSEWHGIRVDGDGRVSSIWLPANDLTGSIPPELGALTGLTTLLLMSNNLTGSIPPELGALTGLTNLVLAGNDLTGPIPPELGALPLLRDLALDGNAIDGAIPPELGSLSSLSTLSLNHNDLTGAIPPELGGLDSLRTLILGSNRLTGTIPRELASLANLQHLGLSDNRLTGSIPAWLGNLENLTYIHLAGNGLSGAIPPELGALTRLSSLWLNYNGLTGAVPAELGALAELIHVNLGANRLTGSLPREFLTLTRLDLLVLGPNDGLCVPETAEFRSWIDGIERAIDVVFCNDPG